MGIMLIFILASGAQSRWQESGGTGLKQFITVNGVPLVRRLYHQAEEYGEASVVVNDATDPIWEAFNPMEPRHEKWMGEMGKFLDTEHLWLPGDVCILYADAYYSDDTLERIFRDPVNQVTIYGRANAPGRTLESFAIRFVVPDHIDEIRRHALPVAEAEQNKRGGPWRWYYHKLTGKLDYSRKAWSQERGSRVSVGALTVGTYNSPDTGWIETGHDTLTDDFDTVGDFNAWAARNPSYTIKMAD